MYFARSITVPAQTAKSSPLRTVMSVGPGWVDEIKVLFPFGCAGLVGVRVLRFEFTIFPLDPDQWIIGDNVLIAGRPEFRMMSEPWELIVEAYNEDDSYSHTVEVHVQVVEHSLPHLIDELIRLGFTPPARG